MRAVLAAAAVVVVDALTKTLIATPPWGMHDSPPERLPLAVVCFAGGIVAAILVPQLAAPIAVVLAGAASNIAWASVGPVPNPFYIGDDLGGFAWNAADMALVGGFVWMVVVVASAWSRQVRSGSWV